MRKINHVVVDKAKKTAAAGGGCLATNVEKACEKEGLMVGFGAVSETGQYRLKVRVGRELRNF